MMRTPKQEVGRILEELDGQFHTLFSGTKIDEIGLAELAFSQLLEQATSGVSLDEMMSGLLTGMADLPIPQEYLQHFLKACAHLVSATLHHQRGNESGAWQQISDAKAEVGGALALFVLSSELGYKKSVLAASGGNGLGKKNNDIKKFVIDAWQLGSFKNPTAAGLAISNRFFKPHENPELNLKDYNAVHLSMDRLPKTFAGWISKKVKSKADGCSASG